MKKYEINQELMESDEFKKGMRELLKAETNRLESVLANGSVLDVLGSVTFYARLVTCARRLSLDVREYQDYIKNKAEEIGLEISE